MATFTITAPTNIDAITGKTSADVYNINGGTLVIDQDSRFGIEANTSATLGTVTVSATLGGTFEATAEFVRLIPFNTGTGNVPAYGTTISQGGASAILSAVYANISSAPTAPGSPMPTSGFIKVRQWNSVAYSAGALTGISATSTGADTAGWIEVVGNANAATSGLMTLNGLGNPSSPQFQGEWYYIGTTPGTPARTDTYQIPSNGNNVFMPGVWVEKSAGANDYEFYYTTSATAVVANVATDSRRGRYCWIATDGTLRFGHDGTNNTGGFVPPANCKIRTGNLFLTMAPTATPTVNSLNATPSNRYRLGGATLPDLTMDKVTCNWYLPITNFGQITFDDSSFVLPMVITQAGEEVQINKCGMGAPVALVAAGGIEFVQCAQGYNVQDSYISYGVFGASARNILRSNLSRNVTLRRCDFGFTGTRPATTNFGLTLISAPNVIVEDCVIAGTVNHTTGNNIEFTGNNEFWFDHTNQVRPATNIGYLFATANSTDVLIDGISFPIAGQLPRSGLMSISNGLRNTLRNIGSYNTPYNFRLYEQNNATWTRVGTTITVTTSAPHGFVVGDRVVPHKASNASAITAAGKDITATPTTTTFEFTGVNTGTTSGTCSFYGTFSSASVFLSIASTNTEDTIIQNVHFKGISGAAFSIDTTAINTYITNLSIDGDYLFHASIGGTNSVIRSLFVGSFPSGVSATLGTHWNDVFLIGEGVPADQVGVTWTRSSGVITVYAPGHNLRSSDYIQTYDSSNPAGATENYITPTIVDEDYFTYTGTASGATSGTISYRVREGLIQINMNAPSSSTTSQAQITSGTPGFTGASSLAAFNAGDQIVFESPDFILGHDSFPIHWPNLPSSGGSPRNNCDIDYQIDRGSGFSGWKNMHVKRTTCSGTAGSASVTVSSTVGLAVDDYVWMNATALGVGVEAKIVSIDSPTTLTLSVVNRTTFSNQTLNFGWHPNETSFPSTGIKLKVRVTVLVAFANAATNFQISTLTTTASRNRLYNQQKILNLLISGMQTGSDIVITEAGTETELININANAGTTYTFPFTEDLSGTLVDIGFYKIGYVPTKIYNFALPSTSASLPVSQVADRNYSNP